MSTPKITTWKQAIEEASKETKVIGEAYSIAKHRYPELLEAVKNAKPVYQESKMILDPSTTGRQVYNPSPSSPLKAMRLKKGMSQLDLANASGISITSISRFETGFPTKRPTAPCYAYWLAKALDCKTGDIYPEYGFVEKYIASNVVTKFAGGAVIAKGN